MKTGEKIRELRIRSNLNQVQFAEILKLSQSAVSAYEKNDRKPSLDVINRIAAYFKVTVDEIMGDEQSMEYNEDQQTFLREIDKKATVLTAADLKKDFKFIVDGREATEEEIEHAVMMIKTLRSMKKAKKKN
ncbi:helix-turn-helix domain-containing protein [Viridibacillus arvi]|uniref:helix-turn-helix domain-containing protein n=1 Tax=Viridibacillus arvi TaxID=263475 RepID=UPI0034CECFE9